MRNIRTYIYILIISLSVNGVVYGQFPGQGLFNGGGTSSTAPNSDNFVPDTININYHYFRTPDKKYAYQDSTLDYHFHQIDPARKRNFEYFTLGNIGSSSYPILFQKRSKIGFNIGQNQYDLYNYTVDNVRIFESSAPFVNARFSPFGDENTFVVKTDFARKFRDSTSIGINYNRYNQAGGYLNQNTKTTNFAGTFSFNKKKYSAQMLFISNVNEEQINGGVVTPEQLSLPEYQQRALVDVNLTNANRRNQEKIYLIQQKYRLNTNITLGTDLGYAGRYYKYADTQAGNATFYGAYWKDDRGVRQYIRTKTWKVNPYLDLKYKASNLSVGLDYNIININDEVHRDQLHQVFAFGIGVFQFSPALSVDYNAKIGIGSAVGQFDASGLVNIDIRKMFKLQGGVNIFRHSPSYQDERMVVSQQEVWNNSFKKSYGLELITKLDIPLLKTVVSAKQTTIDNAIYYDKNGEPVQADNVINALTLTAVHRLDIWRIHLENAIAYQLINNNFYGNPSLYSKHNLFIESKLFKGNLLLRMGGELRIIPSFSHQGYEPVTGMFNITDVKSELYPRADIYITARISKFRAFFKYNNINKAFVNNVEFNVRNHPLYDNSFRMGIAWMFLN